MYSLATRTHLILYKFVQGRCVRNLLRNIYASLALFGAVAAHAVDIGVTIEATPSAQVFPAIELSQSAVRSAPDQGTGLLRVRLQGGAEPRKVRVTLSTEGLLAPTVIETTLQNELVLRPRLDWDVDVLKGWRNTRRQALHVLVETEGASPVMQQAKLAIHPLDEALYFVREGEARIDLGWTFAAWVDPQHPVIDEVLALAGIDPDAPPRVNPDRATLLLQVRAIWEALEKRGLRYADEGAGISQGPSIYSQRVRLLSDSWNDRVANCLDGSVLIASALERLGISSLIVLVPGHAFVGFRLGKGERDAEFLETTLLGQTERIASRQVNIASSGFEAARVAGRTSYQRAAKKLDGRHGPNYAIIDISTARSYGIMPLAVGRGDSTRNATLSSQRPNSTPTLHSPLP
jgi:hypothetical protein